MTAERPFSLGCRIGLRRVRRIGGVPPVVDIKGGATPRAEVSISDNGDVAEQNQPSLVEKPTPKL